MKLNVIRRAANTIHSGSGLVKIFRRMKFYRLAWQHRDILCTVMNEGSSVLFDELLRVRIETLGVLEWPYIHLQWEVKQRLETIAQHYHILEDQRWLHVPISQRIQLISLQDIRPGLSIQLDRPKWFIREGELTLNIFLDNLRLYSIAFSFGRAGSEITAYVGAIQGRGINVANELYSELAKRLHGCRPRDFIVQVMLCLCEAVGVQHCLAVSDACRHHRHPYFKGKQVNADYDQVWSDRGGIKRDDGFFEIPTALKFRDESEILSKKRALYRRRYELLRRIHSEIFALASRNENPRQLIEGDAD